MEKITNSIILGFIPASYFLWTDQFWGACIILFLLMVVDAITGIRKAKQFGEFSSTLAREKTTQKAMNYLTVLVVGYLINVFFLNASIDGYVAQFLMDYIGGFIHCSFIVFAGFLIGVEGYSILENLSKIGVPMPKKITDNWSKNIK